MQLKVQERCSAAYFEVFLYLLWLRRVSRRCENRSETSVQIFTKQEVIKYHHPQYSFIIQFKAVASHGNGISGPMRVIVVILASIYCVG